MKNHLHNEIRFIHSCLPTNRCKIVISLFLVAALVTASNFDRWFLLHKNDPHFVLIYDTRPAEHAATYEHSHDKHAAADGVEHGAAEQIPDELVELDGTDQQAGAAEHISDIQHATDEEHVSNVTHATDEEHAVALKRAADNALADAAFCKSRLAGINEGCNIFDGKWVPDPSPPLYTNDSCPYIFANQDCLTNGRPDTDFLHWTWQPHDCDIPTFDPALFLRLMAGKKMMFVGDSLARNQMQSLLCSIAQVEAPADIRPPPPEHHGPDPPPDHQGIDFMWSFPSYNFTLTMAWCPYLVNYTKEDGTFKLNVDRPDETWTTPLHDYDIAVFSSSYWFFSRSIYYAKGKPISEYDPANATSTEEVLVMKKVWNTVWKYLVRNYGGIAVLRTVSVAHFEGAWDAGGTCLKTQPAFDPHRNMTIPWVNNEILKIQKKEFRKAVEMAQSSNSSCRLRLLDVTYSTLLRPDGHPSSYRPQKLGEPRNDCGHWCLPGPVDTWNRLLFADPQIMCS